MKKQLLFLFLFSMLSFAASSQGDSTTSVFLHIIHGSKPKAPGEYRSIGGYYGGHTVIQLDTFVYGFNYRSRRIHVFARKRKNSGVFEKENLGDWRNDKRKYKITSIEIPVTLNQYAKLKSQYEEYVQHSPHDYAFFGMRCASSCYYMLGQIDVVPRCSMTKSIWKAFHPRMLRKGMVKHAAKRKYTIKTQKGSYSRKWEGG